MAKKKDEPKLSPLEARILELEATLESVNIKAEEAESARMRALADLQNYQRREAEQKQLWSDMAVSHFLKSVLPTFLELQLGKAHTNDEAIKQVIDKFFTNLETSGLTMIKPQAGETLDPHKHEVMMMAEGEPGKIVQTLESGWQYKDTIIIPAKVSAAMEN